MLNKKLVKYSLLVLLPLVVWIIIYKRKPITDYYYSMIGKLKNDPLFNKEIQEISSNIEIKPVWLLGVIYLESNFNPSAKNSYTGAAGLIQFMPDTAKELGTTTEELLRMDAFMQLKYVEAYYLSHKGKLKDFADTYLKVFYPYAIGKPNSYVIGIQKGTKVANIIAKQNPDYDANKDGMITKGELLQIISERVKKGGIFVE